MFYLSHGRSYVGDWGGHCQTIGLIRSSIFSIPKFQYIFLIWCELILLFIVIILLYVVSWDCCPHLWLLASKCCSLLLNIPVAIFPTLFFFALFWCGHSFGFVFFLFFCIKFIILSQKRVLSLFETSKNDFKILKSTRVFFSFFFF